MRFYIPSEIEGLFKNHHLFADKRVEAFQFLGGGSINNAAKIQLSNECLFIKWNDKRHEDFFIKEVKGLKLLLDAGMNVPDIIAQDNHQSISFLLLSYVERGNENGDFWSHFAQQLSNLHKQQSNLFGLDHDNYIGSLPQKNTRQTDWVDFFINNRLSVQLEQVFNKGLCDQTMLVLFEKLYTQLHNLLPMESPSLLHGDLWKGNYLVNTERCLVLIDPAVYYGHREVEIAFTKLFGGFDDFFYNYYHEYFPMEKGFDQRVDIYNLYPLLVHANLFGASYMSTVKNIVNKFL